MYAASTECKRYLKIASFTIALTMVYNECKEYREGNHGKRNLIDRR
jgi:hypothetical protein